MKRTFDKYVGPLMLIAVGVGALFVMWLGNRPKAESAEAMLDRVGGSISGQREKKLLLRRANIDAPDLGALHNVKGIYYIDLGRTAVDESAIRNLYVHRNVRVLLLDATQITDSSIDEVAMFEDLRELNVDDTRISDEWLSGIEAVNGLTSLSLRRTRVSDVGLKHLAKATSLQQLRLDGTKVTNAGLEYVHAMPNLRLLGLSQTGISDCGIANLSMHPSLRELDLSGTQVSERALIDIGRIKSLETLILVRTDVEASGLRHLSNLQLRSINLAETAVDDSEIEALECIRTLEVLRLDGCTIGDAAVPHLLKLPRLQELWAVSTQLSDVGFVELCKHPSLVFVDVSKTNVSRDVIDSLRRKEMHLTIAGP